MSAFAKEISKRKVIISSGIANAFEWYDYSLFGHLAAIIGSKFFPTGDSTADLLNAFLLFAVGYVMRPVGGIIFGIIGDKYGRKIAISAAIAMTIARVIQGLSMGGALTGASSFLIEHSPKHKRGFMGSTSMASLCVGVLMSSLVIYITQYILGDAMFVEWGWRIPFLLGFLVIYPSIYIKNHTAETPIFIEAEANNQLAQHPLTEVLSKYKFRILLSIFINSTGSVIFYLLAIYLVNYLKLRFPESLDAVYLIANMSFVLMIFVTLLSGFISDQIGRAKLYFANLICIIVSSNYIMHILEFGDLSSISVVMLMLAIMAACYIGPEPALQAALYPAKIRNTSLSLSYNIATTLFGGTTPYFIGLMSLHYGGIAVISYYIIACAMMSLSAIYIMRKKI